MSSLRQDLEKIVDHDSECYPMTTKCICNWKGRVNKLEALVNKYVDEQLLEYGEHLKLEEK